MIQLFGDGPAYSCFIEDGDARRFRSENLSLTYERGVAAVRVVTGEYLLGTLHPPQKSVVPRADIVRLVLREFETKDAEYSP